MDPAPFLRGNAYPGTRSVPYPRADVRDVARMPADTWAMAQIPAGVRLEFVATGDEAQIRYETKTDDPGIRGDAAGRTFQLWQRGECVCEEKAVLGESVAILSMHPGGRAIVYLPEGMKPRILGVDGSLEPAPESPRWICHGDSIAEGWSATAPALAWPAVAARDHDLDLVNMGYAGAARGEIVTAEQIAALPADVISIAYGTNCWARVPHTPEQMAANLEAFLRMVRDGHPATPVVVLSPTIRTDAETKPNRLGATLADLRAAMEEIAAARDDVTLVRGAAMIDASDLADEVHPNDAGHAKIAAAVGPVLAGVI